MTLPQIFQQYQIDTIDFLKLDCEGSEYDILYNLGATMFERIAVISLEFHDLHDPERSGYTLALFFLKMGYTITKFAYLETISKVHSGQIIAVNNRKISHVSN